MTFADLSSLFSQSFRLPTPLPAPFPLVSVYESTNCWKSCVLSLSLIHLHISARRILSTLFSLSPSTEFLIFLQVSVKISHPLEFLPIHHCCWITSKDQVDPPETSRSTLQYEKTLTLLHLSRICNQKIQKESPLTSLCL